MPQFSNTVLQEGLKSFIPQRKGTGRVSKLSSISKQLFKAHYDGYHPRVARQLATALKRYINAKPKHEKTSDFVGDIRRKILCLHEYNVEIAKVKFKYPRSEQFDSLLIQYVELECDLLYNSYKEINKDIEDDATQKVVRLLRLILHDALQNGELSLKASSRACDLALLKLLANVRVECVTENRLLSNTITKLLTRLSLLEEVQKLKGKNISFHKDTLLKDELVCNIRQSLETSDYYSDDDSDDEIESDFFLHSVEDKTFFNGSQKFFTNSLPWSSRSNDFERVTHNKENLITNSTNSLKTNLVSKSIEEKKFFSLPDKKIEPEKNSSTIGYDAIDVDALPDYTSSKKSSSLRENVTVIEIDDNSEDDGDDFGFHNGFSTHYNSKTEIKLEKNEENRSPDYSSPNPEDNQNSLGPQNSSRGSTNAGGLNKMMNNSSGNSLRDAEASAIVISDSEDEAGAESVAVIEEEPHRKIVVALEAREEENSFNQEVAKEQHDVTEEVEEVIASNQEDEQREREVQRVTEKIDEAVVVCNQEDQEENVQDVIEETEEAVGASNQDDQAGREVTEEVEEAVVTCNREDQEGKVCMTEEVEEAVITSNQAVREVHHIAEEVEEAVVGFNQENQAGSEGQQVIKEVEEAVAFGLEPSKQNEEGGSATKETHHEAEEVEEDIVASDQEAPKQNNEVGSLEATEKQHEIVEIQDAPVSSDPEILKQNVEECDEAEDTVVVSAHEEPIQNVENITLSLTGETAETFEEPREVKSQEDCNLLDETSFDSVREGEGKNDTREEDIYEKSERITSRDPETLYLEEPNLEKCGESSMSEEVIIEESNCAISGTTADQSTVIETDNHENSEETVYLEENIKEHDECISSEVGLEKEIVYENSEVITYSEEIMDVQEMIVEDDFENSEPVAQSMESEEVSKDVEEESSVGPNGEQMNPEKNDEISKVEEELCVIKEKTSSTPTEEEILLGNVTVTDLVPEEFSVISSQTESEEKSSSTLFQEEKEVVEAGGDGQMEPSSRVEDEEPLPFQKETLIEKEVVEADDDSCRVEDEELLPSQEETLIEKEVVEADQKEPSSRVGDEEPSRSQEEILIEKEVVEGEDDQIKSSSRVEPLFSQEENLEMACDQEEILLEKDQAVTELCEIPQKQEETREEVTVSIYDQAISIATSEVENEVPSQEGEASFSISNQVQSEEILELETQENLNPLSEEENGQMTASNIQENLSGEEQEVCPVPVEMEQESVESVVVHSDEVCAKETFVDLLPVSETEGNTVGTPAVYAPTHDEYSDSTSDKKVGGGLQLLAEIAADQETLTVKTDSEKDTDVEPDSKMIIQSTPKRRRSKVKFDQKRKPPRTIKTEESEFTRITRSKSIQPKVETTKPKEANDNSKFKTHDFIATENSALKINSNTTKPKETKNDNSKYKPHDFIATENSALKTNNVYAQKLETNIISEESNDSCGSTLYIDEGAEKPQPKSIYEEDTICEMAEFVSTEIRDDLPTPIQISIPENQDSLTDNLQILKQMEDFVNSSHQQGEKEETKEVTDELQNAQEFVVSVATSDNTKCAKTTDHSIETILNKSPTIENKSIVPHEIPDSVPEEPENLTVEKNTDHCEKTFKTKAAMKAYEDKQENLSIGMQTRSRSKSSEDFINHTKPPDRARSASVDCNSLSTSTETINESSSSVELSKSHEDDPNVSEELEDDTKPDTKPIEKIDASLETTVPEEKIIVEIPLKGFNAKKHSDKINLDKSPKTPKTSHKAKEQYLEDTIKKVKERVIEKLSTSEQTEESHRKKHSHSRSKSHSDHERRSKSRSLDKIDDRSSRSSSKSSEGKKHKHSDHHKKHSSKSPSKSSKTQDENILKTENKSSRSKSRNHCKEASHNNKFDKNRVSGKEHHKSKEKENRRSHSKEKTKLDKSSKNAGRHSHERSKEEEHDSQILISDPKEGSSKDTTKNRKHSHKRSRKESEVVKEKEDLVTINQDDSKIFTKTNNRRRKGDTDQSLEKNKERKDKVQQENKVSSSRSKSRKYSHEGTKGESDIDSKEKEKHKENIATDSEEKISSRSKVRKQSNERQRMEEEDKVSSRPAKNRKRNEEVDPKEKNKERKEKEELVVESLEEKVSARSKSKKHSHSKAEPEEVVLNQIQIISKEKNKEDFVIEPQEEKISNRSKSKKEEGQIISEEPPKESISKENNKEHKEKEDFMTEPLEEKVCSRSKSRKVVAEEVVLDLSPAKESVSEDKNKEPKEKEDLVIEPQEEKVSSRSKSRKHCHSERAAVEEIASDQGQIISKESVSKEKNKEPKEKEDPVIEPQEEKVSSRSKSRKHCHSERAVVDEIALDQGQIISKESVSKEKYKERNEKEDLVIDPQEEKVSSRSKSRRHFHSEAVAAEENVLDQGQVTSKDLPKDKHKKCKEKDDLVIEPQEEKGSTRSKSRRIVAEEVVLVQGQIIFKEKNKESKEKEDLLLEPQEENKVSSRSKSRKHFLPEAVVENVVLDQSHVISKEILKDKNKEREKNEDLAIEPQEEKVSSKFKNRKEVVEKVVLDQTQIVRKDLQKETVSRDKNKELKDKEDLVVELPEEKVHSRSKNRRTVAEEVVLDRGQIVSKDSPKETIVKDKHKERKEKEDSMIEPQEENSSKSKSRKYLHSEVLSEKVVLDQYSKDSIKEENKEFKETEDVVVEPQEEKNSSRTKSRKHFQPEAMAEEAVLDQNSDPPKDIPKKRKYEVIEEEPSVVPTKLARTEEADKNRSHRVDEKQRSRKSKSREKEDKSRRSHSKEKPRSDKRDSRKQSEKDRREKGGKAPEEVKTVEYDPKRKEKNGERKEKGELVAKIVMNQLIEQGKGPEEFKMLESDLKGKEMDKNQKEKVENTANNVVEEIKTIQSDSKEKKRDNERQKKREGFQELDLKGKDKGEIKIVESDPKTKERDKGRQEREVDLEKGPAAFNTMESDPKGKEKVKKHQDTEEELKITESDTKGQEMNNEDKVEEQVEKEREESEPKGLILEDKNVRSSQVGETKQDTEEAVDNKDQEEDKVSKTDISKKRKYDLVVPENKETSVQLSYESFTNGINSISCTSDKNDIIETSQMSTTKEVPEILPPVYIEAVFSSTATDMVLQASVDSTVKHLVDQEADLSLIPTPVSVASTAADPDLFHTSEIFPTKLPQSLGFNLPATSLPDSMNLVQTLSTFEVSDTTEIETSKTNFVQRMTEISCFMEKETPTEHNYTMSDPLVGGNNEDKNILTTGLSLSNSPEEFPLNEANLEDLSFNANNFIGENNDNNFIEENGTLEELGLLLTCKKEKPESSFDNIDDADALLKPEDVQNSIKELNMMAESQSGQAKTVSVDSNIDQVNNADRSVNLGIDFAVNELLLLGGGEVPSQNTSFSAIPNIHNINIIETNDSSKQTLDEEPVQQGDFNLPNNYSPPVAIETNQKVVVEPVEQCIITTFDQIKSNDTIIKVFDKIKPETKMYRPNFTTFLNSVKNANKTESKPTDDIEKYMKRRHNRTPVVPSKNKNSAQQQTTPSPKVEASDSNKHQNSRIRVKTDLIQSTKEDSLDYINEHDQNVASEVILPFSKPSPEVTTSSKKRKSVDVVEGSGDEKRPKNDPKKNSTKLNNDEIFDQLLREGATNELFAETMRQKQQENLVKKDTKKPGYFTNSSKSTTEQAKNHGYSTKSSVGYSTVDRYRKSTASASTHLRHESSSKNTEKHPTADKKFGYFTSNHAAQRFERGSGNSYNSKSDPSSTREYKTRDRRASTERSNYLYPGYSSKKETSNQQIEDDKFKWLGNLNPIFGDPGVFPSSGDKR